MFSVKDVEMAETTEKKKPLNTQPIWQEWVKLAAEKEQNKEIDDNTRDRSARRHEFLSKPANIARTLASTGFVNQNLFQMYANQAQMTVSQ